MSRPKGYAEQAAKTNFRKELEKSMVDIGVRSRTQLSGMVDIPERTLQRRFEDVGEIKLNELKSILEVLRVDPEHLLRLVYPAKEVARFYKKMEQT